MKRQIHAELLRFFRKRPLVISLLLALVFSIASVLAIYSSADDAPSNPRGVSLSDLSAPGGGTEAFSAASSFIGVFIFVIFISLIAGEFTSGTFRALLLRNPRRRSVIIGKVAGILLVAAVLVGIVEFLTFATSLLVASQYDVSTHHWFEIESLRLAITGYLTVMAGVTGWAVFGAMLAVILRSTPLAIGMGIAWSGPFENIVVDSWNDGYRYFPGQVLAAIVRGGTLELSLDRALITGSVYAALAATIALALISRRDVTA